jgi:hypothetical protein
MSEAVLVPMGFKDTFDWRTQIASLIRASVFPLVLCTASKPDSAEDINNFMEFIGRVYLKDKEY